MLERYSRVLITGGAGFIGSHLCEEVARQGKRLVVIDDLSTGKKENLPEAADFIQVDICSGDGLEEAMKGVDLVFHLAAQPSASMSVEDPERDFNSNAAGTYKVLWAAREAGVKRFIYTSSAAGYGEQEKQPIAETAFLIPGTPYGASKLCGEHYCSAFGIAFGMLCTCLRPFNVYGTRENLETSGDEVAKYTLAISRGELITVTGDGNQGRDFVNVGDVVRGHILAADNDAGIGQVFNLGSGRETTINGLIAKIEAATGRTAVRTSRPSTVGDIRREFADVSHSRKVLGFEPRVTLEEGIAALLAELQATGGT